MHAAGPPPKARPMEDRSMGLRESLNQQNPKIVLGVTAAIIVIVVMLYFIFEGGGSAVVGAESPKAFFSSDDGKTWFADDANKLPPFDTGGKETLRAYVYRCGDGKEFVAFLERFTPQGKARRQAARDARADGEKAAPPLLDQSNGLEVKMPGNPTWVSESDPRAEAIMSPRCPGAAKPQIILP
jgi:hypothetical protein